MNIMIDGNRITSLVLVYFFFYARPLVEAGKVYKVLPPLYKITEGKGKNKKSIFINNNKEYVKYLYNKISKNIVIHGYDKDGNFEKLSEEDIENILLTSSEYKRKLRKMAKKAVCRTELFEYIISNLHYLNEDNLDKFEKEIKKKSKNFKVKQVNQDLVTVNGLYKREMELIRITDKTMSKSKPLQEYYHSCKWKKFEIDNKELSLIELLDILDSYEPAEKQRYKGLGEMNAIALGETTLEPGKRQLIRLTINDVEKEIDQLLILHSESNKYRQERKALMSKFKISVDDIDS